jgi:hypothetical protein
LNNLLTPIQVISMGVVAGVLLLCYAIVPYVGGGFLMGIDNAAFGLRWLGISTPIAEWSVIGAIVGGLIALSRTFRRYGMPGHLKTIVICGGACLAFLYVISFIYSQTMKPVLRTPRATVAPAVTTE